LNAGKTPQPKPIKQHDEERSKKKAIIMTPKKILENIEAVVGNITFETITVRNRTH